MFASSSCALRMFSCICCACFISAPSWPFIMGSPLFLRWIAVVGRPYRRGHDLRAKVADEVAHEGIFLDRLRGARLPFRHLARARGGHAVSVRRADANGQADAGAE